MSVWCDRTDTAGGVGVVILPPVGYAFSSSHRTVRVLADRLANSGATVAVVNYPGTGDSAGMAPDLEAMTAAAGRVTAWMRDRWGTDRHVVVGVGLGGRIAMRHCAAHPDDVLVAVEPVLSGRRHLRELRLMGEAAPDGSSISIGGYAFDADLLAAIGADPDAVDLTGVRGLVIAPNATGLDLGEGIETVDCSDGDRFLRSAAETATVGREVIDLVAARVQREIDLCGPLASGVDTAVTQEWVGMRWQGRAVEESVVEIGASGHVGVMTRAAVGHDQRDLVVLVNSGSDPHQGPGRSWVELARELVRPDLSVLRVDFASWGDSAPRAGCGVDHAGRPYDRDAADDVATIVEALSADPSVGRVVLGGMCAGAWTALDAARTVVGVCGVIALNPQLYWQQGDPIEALITDTRRRRQQEIADIAAGARAGDWDHHDPAAPPHRLQTWFDDLVARGVGLHFLFSEGDDGIEYLRDRHGRLVAELARSRSLTITEIPDLDHGMQRTWLRPLAFAAWADAVRDCMNTAEMRIVAAPSEAPVSAV